MMKVTINSRASVVDRLRERLDRVEHLRCDRHDAPVESVEITTFENGWFDSNLIGCCDELVKHASSIIGRRC
jgi:hypothetical protein